MNIYVFERADGSQWCDYTLPKGAKVLRRIEANRLDDIERVAQNEGGRIAALARRALDEAKARQVVEPVPPEYAKRSLLGRLKWALTGG